ncbi:PilZ domain-containing protein [uncultured Desulfobacter sp.]|uniref:PilZ domain-containing protein n=1 Tax=uncultured Desulfobacter sp. TaxID=240139 RepID=UPI0029F47C1C|nr:PilZ domain-containing protein [uncultured Desulfobacter sp.]
MNILFILIISVILIIICVYLFRLFRWAKRDTDTATAKNIYVLSYNRSIDEDVFPEAGTAGPRAKVSEESERRRFPRTEFHGFVDFINKGILYKGQARDLSYSGIFIKSKTPEKYKKNDFIVITFQTAGTGPQRRNGQIARVDHTGIGVDFLS